MSLWLISTDSMPLIDGTFRAVRCGDAVTFGVRLNFDQPPKEVVGSRTSATYTAHGLYDLTARILELRGNDCIVDFGLLASSEHDELSSDFETGRLVYGKSALWLAGDETRTVAISPVERRPIAYRWNIERIQAVTVRRSLLSHDRFGDGYFPDIATARYHDVDSTEIIIPNRRWPFEDSLWFVLLHCHDLGSAKVTV
jgi:hypothetical protein